MGERGQCWCSGGPEGPSTAHGKEEPGCEKWGPETTSTSSQTVYLDGGESEEDAALNGQVTHRQLPPEVGVPQS